MDRILDAMTFFFSKWVSFTIYDFFFVTRIISKFMYKEFNKWNILIIYDTLFLYDINKTKTILDLHQKGNS